MPAVGEVWAHPDYYVDPDTGESLTKYMLILAVNPANGDLIFRLLTSRDYNRPNVPACIHSGDRPGFYLGVPQPQGTLCKDTWLDLREQEDDFDARDFARMAAIGKLALIHTLAKNLLCHALMCAAYAQDTTKGQTRHIMNTRDTLGC